ncbi:MAG: hypothetical protein HY851_11545 [candidate division Zixibacteria bacterium]|nr:hypothetical protein [candidate division Zixibacteria bacterium]
MAHHDASTTAVTELIAVLSDESLVEIDLDAIRKVLESSVGAGSAVSQLSEELTILREDYISRIVGMAKALAVARQTGEALAEATELAESLPSMSSPQLVEQYRRTTAKFRDAFPSSFGLPASSRRRADGRHNYSDYK